MSDRDSRLLHQCWANRPSPFGSGHTRCLERVPGNPDHIGLCDTCLAHKRSEQRQVAA